jgi:peptidoglycan/xylan/chitin deacetylase (PgdA/CDA1 family)
VSSKKQRGPRAHWFLLGLFLVFLLAELCFHGYVTGAGREGSGPTATGIGPEAAGDITSGGPVLRISDNAVQTARVPAKTIALTFDDGPNPRWTPQILAMLDEFHVHATFFEIGSQVNEYPQITKDVVAQGSEVGVHTFTHPDMTAAQSWRRRLEMSLGADAIAGSAGVTPTLMRPPYSSVPSAVTTSDLCDYWRPVRMARHRERWLPSGPRRPRHGRLAAAGG